MFPHIYSDKLSSEMHNLDISLVYLHAVLD